MSILGAISGTLAGVFSKEVRAGLPPDGWLVASGHFRFGYPWPWRVWPDAGGLVDQAGAEVPTHVIGALYAPRSTGSAQLLVWPAGGSLRATMQSIDARLARLYGGTCCGTRRVRVAGAPAVVVDLELPGREWVSRILVSDRDDQLVHLELRTPLGSAAGYRPHLDTMLGSWSWH